MFQMHLFKYQHNEEETKLEYVFIKCSNCDRITCLFLKVKTVVEISTNFVLNTKLHHVVLSWIIYSKKQMKQYINENNHPDWFNKGPPYNKAKMLGLKSFITMMKLHKNGSKSYENFFQKILNMKSKPLSHDKKNSCY